MSRTLLLACFLPFLAEAQENASALGNAPTAPQAAVETGAGGNVPLGAGLYSALGLSFGQQATTPAQTPASRPTPTRTPAPPSPPTGEPRPTVEGSMIGYIENAIPGSQIRIRIEAGFDMNLPDRAEFFYAKCGCYASNLKGTGNPAYDPNAPGPGPGVVTKLNYQELYLHGEYGIGRRFSVFTDVPFRWIQPQAFVPGFGSFSNEAGLGDVQAGFKLAPLVSARRYLTFQLKSYFRSGDGSRGLGTNHYSIEPALLYYQTVSRRAAVESQAGIWHPMGGSVGVVSATSAQPERFAGNVFFYGVGPSYVVYNGERIRIAPVIELVGWQVLGGFETVWSSATRIGIPASGTDIVNLKFGVRTTIGVHSSVYAGYGRALTAAVWYSDIVRVEYRYAF